MDNPKDEELLKFIAGFVGWTQLNKPLTEPLEGLPPGYEADSTWPTPDYLSSVDLWLKDVWPKLRGSENEWEWMDKLCKICGEDSMTHWANATARDRCLALWITLKGKS